jgi:ATP-dependent Clp protease ATP-binding subunit ClpB
MNKFDSIVLGSLDIAQSRALKDKNTQFEPEHLLYGLIKNPSSFSSKKLKKHLSEVDTLVDGLAKSSTPVSMEQLRMSARLQQWLTLASGHAAETGRQEVSERDLLRYMPEIFPSLKVDYSSFNQNDEQEEIETPEFLTDLNELAANGKLDPVIGRTKEIRSVIEILGRRGKNNPVLVGPAGVGKTAIVEGLADQIVKDEVPDVLKGKTVYSLELGSLMAGTKFRGEFEERIQQLLKFMKSKNGEAIVFIDEIHQLVGAGRTDGAMDAANLLKPALARGELHCVGATTPEEFQKYILNDSALERRFRSVPVNEPSQEDAIEILMGIRPKHEAHHGIKISEDAIYSAVTLSDQYITDKNLPDKAIDLVDEAASAMKLTAETMPSRLQELESEIRSKRIRAQVEKNNKEIEKEIDTLQCEFDEEKLKWDQQVLVLKKSKEVQGRLDRAKFDLEAAERTQNYEEASRLKYSVIPELENELEENGHNWILGREQIAQVISRQTGVPLEKILKTRQDNILKLEEVLNSRVYGQNNALKEICDTLIASYAGLSDETRPLGSFLLLGPTGVGKTETAKALTEYLFDTEKNMIRIDLSEFSEKHSVAKLIGAPAGYVGYDDGGVLTEAVRRKPHSVILFDEIEKAHPDFADILLQILDDGRLTDNKGRTINFKNTIVMMTSNSKNIEVDFKPEVIGRLDAVLEYNSLDKSVMKELIMKQVKLLNARLKSKNLEVKLDESLMSRLLEQGYDPKYGARPLNSVFNKLVTRPLSKKILNGEMPTGVITFGGQGENLNFS